MSIADPQSFLVNFGYLPGTSGDGHSVEAVAGCDRLSPADVAGLPETGEWDAQTDLRVSRARCGCSDVAARPRRDELLGYGT